VRGAGRTDAGVHGGAGGGRSTSRVGDRAEAVRGLNAVLPAQVAIVSGTRLSPNRSTTPRHGEAVRYAIWKTEPTETVSLRTPAGTSADSSTRKDDRRGRGAARAARLAAFPRGETASDENPVRNPASRGGQLARPRGHKQVEGDAFLKNGAHPQRHPRGRGPRQGPPRGWPQILAGRDSHPAGQTAPAEGLTRVRGTTHALGDGPEFARSEEDQRPERSAGLSGSETGRR